jgi:hypothetical protein
MRLQPSPWLDTTALCSGKRLRILLDWGACGKVRSITGKYRLFSLQDDVLYLSGLVGGDTGTFSGSKEQCHDRAPTQTPPKRQDRGIPDYDLCSCSEPGK